ncbi:hypothetical protein AVEN_240040-1 [Araneus ventricosus]|uniref:Uncharacterized protein n=1 Tax=Araneus ventricosus TaxID=182803 RepID=A0A4Y2VX83_ARAVE|nr:hypothetical protein AVEN_240040-1 [Araneus ventricosus]
MQEMLCQHRKTPQFQTQKSRGANGFNSELEVHPGAGNQRPEGTVKGCSTSSGKTESPAKANATKEKKAGEGRKYKEIPWLCGKKVCIGESSPRRLGR